MNGFQKSRQADMPVCIQSKQPFKHRYMTINWHEIVAGKTCLNRKLTMAEWTVNFNTYHGKVILENIVFSVKTFCCVLGPHEENKFLLLPLSQSKSIKSMS